MEMDHSLRHEEHATVAESFGSSGNTELMEPRDVTDVGVYTQDIVMSIDNTVVGVVTQVGADMDSESDIIYDDGVDDSDNSNHDGADLDGEGNANANVHQDPETKGSKLNERQDYSNDSGDIDRSGSLSQDQVRVVWMNQSETVHNINDVRVIDRAFLHGDIVAAASYPTGQVGVVKDVNISVDLLGPNGSNVMDVSSRCLRRVTEFTLGDYVVLGPWLGRVDDVYDDITLLFDDGAMCEVMKADPKCLEPFPKNFLGEYVSYHPGQRVRESSSSVFQSARWISGLWNASHVYGTVTHVTVGSVFVRWLASAGYGLKNVTTPAVEQSPKNLKLLSCFTHTCWQVGDWCFLPSSAISHDIQGDKSSSCVKSNECVSKDQETKHSVQSILLEQSGENHLSLQNITATDLDSVPNLDRHSGNVDTSILLGSKSCTSSLTVSEEPVHENRPVLQKKLHKDMMSRERKGRKIDENFEKALKIVNTKRRIDVVWQDGKRQLGMISTNLIPVYNPGDQEFVAEQFVVEKATEEDHNVSSVRRVGVVNSVNAKERTACVRWLKKDFMLENSTEFDNEDVMSVYELESHPDYDYCYGDVVIRLTPVSGLVLEDDLAYPVEKVNEQVDLNEAISKRQSKVKEIEDAWKCESYADFSDLSWVGNISALKDGDIEVTWADGTVSMVGPQSVYVVGRDDDEESIGADNDIIDSDTASWERDSEEETDAAEPANQIDPLIWEYGSGKEPHSPGAIDASESSARSSSPESNTIDGYHALNVCVYEQQDVLDPDGTDKDAGSQNSNSIITSGEKTADSEEGSSVHNSPLSIPLATLGFSKHLLAGFFLWGKEHMGPLISKYSKGNESQSPGAIDAVERRASSTGSSSQQSKKIDGCSAPIASNNEEQEALVPKATNEVMVSETLSKLTSDQADYQSILQSYSNDCSNFKHFDIAKEPLDHYFVDANEQTNIRWKCLNKVQQEWSILLNNLPDSIYVRVYEDRMDLLRAVIVGAYGTPYQDGLFVFDFHLPTEYPQVPPSAYYHSGGWKINPNLYEDGNVCLSLLNTWSGRGNEIWVSSSSSILQVLVSLQGLVLNSKPYFNEAGYDKQVGSIEGEKNSRSYNENTFLLNCKSIMYLLRKPPKKVWTVWLARVQRLEKSAISQKGRFLMKICCYFAVFISGIGVH